MERYIIETPDGYIQGISYNDPEYTEDVNEALQFKTADEAWDFVDFYFTDDYDEQEALGIYVNKLEYPDEQEASDINVSLLNNEVDSLLDLVNDRLSSEDSLPIGGSLSDLLSAASKLLGKKK